MKRCVALSLCLLWPFATLAEDASTVADREWRAYLEPLAPIGARMAEMMPNPGDPQLRHELYRFLYSQMAAAYIGLL